MLKKELLETLRGDTGKVDLSENRDIMKSQSKNISFSLSSYNFSKVKKNHCVKNVQIGVISVPYFLVFGLNTGKYGPGIILYLETFHAVNISKTNSKAQKYFTQRINLV